MRKKSIILIGAGGHSKSCLDVIEETKKYRVCGYIGMPYEVGHIINGIEVIGCDEDLPKFVKKIDYALVSMGQIKDFHQRLEIFQLASRLGFQFPTIVSPFAFVSRNSRIGEGTIVMHGAIINSNTTIGSNCIINSKSLIEHDTRIGNNSHISTGVILNGNVTIGNNVFIGSGAIVKNQVVIGDGKFVPMGVSITGDLIDQSPTSKNNEYL
jgi:sugar O-acyltransferase (sialic acid O-acetyltransferase NeuD family)